MTVPRRRLKTPANDSLAIRSLRSLTQSERQELNRLLKQPEATVKLSSAVYLFLMAHKASNVRRYNVPFEKTGEAEIASPRSFSASAS